MLAAFLIPLMTTVPSFTASTSACWLRAVMPLLSELPFASTHAPAARTAHPAARRPVQIAVHYLRRRPARARTIRPGRLGPLVPRGTPILAPKGTAGPHGTRVAAADLAAGPVRRAPRPLQPA